MGVYHLFFRKGGCIFVRKALAYYESETHTFKGKFAQFGRNLTMLVKQVAFAQNDYINDVSDHVWLVLPKNYQDMLSPEKLKEGDEIEFDGRVYSYRKKQKKATAKDYGLALMDNFKIITAEDEK